MSKTERISMVSEYANAEGDQEVNKPRTISRQNIVNVKDEPTSGSGSKEFDPERQAIAEENRRKEKNKKTLMYVGIGAVVVVAGYFLFFNKKTKVI